MLFRNQGLTFQLLFFSAKFRSFLTWTILEFPLKFESTTSLWNRPHSLSRLLRIYFQICCSASSLMCVLYVPPFQDETNSYCLRCQKKCSGSVFTPFAVPGSFTISTLTTWGILGPRLYVTFYNHFKRIWKTGLPVPLPPFYIVVDPDSPGMTLWSQAPHQGLRVPASLDSCLIF